MARQNFLSRESFVEATEIQAKESLLSIPVFAPNIKLIEENANLQQYRFRYQIPQKNVEYHVNVTLLPLDTQFTRISLHGTHANGESFDNDSEMMIALHDFESAIQAALNGNASAYRPYQPYEKKSRKFLQLAATVVASAGIFILKKKLS